MPSQIGHPVHDTDSFVSRAAGQGRGMTTMVDKGYRWLGMRVVNGAEVRCSLISRPYRVTIIRTQAPSSQDSAKRVRIEWAFAAQNQQYNTISSLVW